MSRGLLVTLCGVVAISLATTAGASADDSVYTRQAQAINAEFLRDLPAPEGGAGAICIVNSGVDLTPDLEDAVIYRTALDGGSPDDLSATDHGTSVASVAAAVKNGWGSVGLWPAVKIVSVRASSADDPDHYGKDEYIQGVNECLYLKEFDGYNQINTVSLSSSNAEITDSELVELENPITRASEQNVNIVASAGNESNATAVNYPARFETTFAIGASDTTSGEFCSFSNRGEGLDASAPGCGLDTADVDGNTIDLQGTSLSAPIVAAALVALRSYRTDLTASEVEQLLLDSAQITGAGRVLDVEAAFRAAGLGSYVDQYAPAATSTTEPSTAEGSTASTSTADSTTGYEASTTETTTAASTQSQSSADSNTQSAGIASKRLRRPKVVSSYRSVRRLSLWLASIPKGAIVVIKVGRRTLRFRHATLRDLSVTVPMRRWRTVKLRFYIRTLGFSSWTKVAPTPVARRL